MWGTSASKLKQTKEGEDLTSATALTSFFMDTFMCNEFHLKSQECMQDYDSMYRIRFRRRSKLHKECMNFLDEYKACVIGMNQQSLGAGQRTTLSE